MKNQKFGIEIETTGLNRANSAHIIAGILGEGTRIEHRSSYDAWVAIGPDGREWKAMSDASVTGSSTGMMAEIVSPICGWDDIELIQSIVRALKSAGAKTDHSCGIHIHVGAEGFDAKALTRLAKTVYRKEGLVHAALGISPGRIEDWCRPVEPDFIERLSNRKPRTLEDFARAWYDTPSWEYRASQHYDHSRYHLLNLHALFQKGRIRDGKVERLGTIEFRAFDGTLHAGKIKAYIQFCLALTHQAKASKSATAREDKCEATKYTMRCWLLRLGFIGDEYKTARIHLMSLLPGDSAWRTPAQRAAARG